MDKQKLYLLIAYLEELVEDDFGRKMSKDILVNHQFFVGELDCIIEHLYELEKIRNT